MRNFIFVCLVAVAVALAVAWAVGLVAVTSDHVDGKYFVTFALDTDMLHSHSGVPLSHSSNDADVSLLEVKGKITAVRPDKSELVVSESLKSWTFQMAKDSKVYINDREAKLSELQAGDEAAVVFDRQGQRLIATMVRTTRK